MTSFKYYYDNWGVQKTKWPLRPLPLLTQEAADVYFSLSSSSKRDYESVGLALCKHFQVSQETYRQKPDDYATKGWRTLDWMCQASAQAC